MPKSLEMPTNIEAKEKNENAYNLNKYWKKYNFPGNPPRPDTLAEKKIIDASIDYIDIAKECGVYNNQTISEARRRLRHDALALLIFGKPRTDLNMNMADKLGDFASFLTTGRSLQETVNEAVERKNDSQYL